MEYYVLYSVPVLSSFFSVLIFVLFVTRKSNFHSDNNKAVPVIDLVKTLGKLCPLNTANNWELLPVDFGFCRSWKQILSFPVVNEVCLYGSYSLVNCTSEKAFTFICDVSKWAEWNPYHSAQYISKSFNDKHLKQDRFMDAKQIINISRDKNILPHTVMYRFHKFYKNKVGWLLFFCAKNFEFMYFLIQPDKSGTCIVTHIMGTTSKHTSSLSSIVTQRLRNIQDIATVSYLDLVPLVMSEKRDRSPQSFQKLMDNCFIQNAITSQRKETIQTVFILVPFFSSYFIWTSLKGFKLGVKGLHASASGSTTKAGISKKEYDSASNKPVPKQILRRAVSDLTVRHHNLLTNLSSNSNVYLDNAKPRKAMVSSDSSEDSEVCEKSKRKSLEMSCPRTKLRSLSETAINDFEVTESKGDSKKSSSQCLTLDEIKEIDEDSVLAIDKQDPSEFFNSSIEILEDYEILETNEFSENIIAGFMTHGNYGASELQAEYLAASQLDENAEFAGGWVLHSAYKGLLVLSKTTKNDIMEIASYMCQTVVNVPPKDVWMFVKNPHFRFICDETVKTVEVLEKISSSQKLIHTYHETSGILRKEHVDFCLLQTEREELNRYYSCFNSIEFHKCPLMHSVTRGNLRPSGWIIEAADEESKTSKVVYLVQILINSPNSLFIQDMGNLVPQSVYNLKNYIAIKPFR